MRFLKNITVLALLRLPLAAQSPEVLQFVNPFIGTGGHGHTYPGATTPFGFVQLSPDTRPDPTEWDGCGGYHFTDSLIYGFSHTHLSGTGVSDFCDVLLMPFTGFTNFENTHYRSAFRKENEHAEAGYYSVFLEKDRIKAELTATERVGIHRYTFPENIEKGSLLIDLRHRDIVLDAYLEAMNDREIVGYRRSRSWANDQHLYFVIRFSKPFVVPRFFDLTKSATLSSTIVNSTACVGTLDFLQDGKPLVVTVGISAVSLEGARKNLEAEANHFDFDKVKSATQQKWVAQLSKIKISGGTTEQKNKFYTALYHTMVVPNIFSDIDGKYRGRDQKIHESERNIYSVFSLWDTYRAAHPLYTILEPERAQDFIFTFLKQYEQGGLLPVWELAACETDCMIGNHAIPVIADAWLKNLRHFDGEKALEAMMKSANADRYGLEKYRTLGYLPSELEPESVSKTLEYAFDDWAIARMAESIGNQEVMEEFDQRAQFYKNVFDASSGFFRAKNNATWHEPFDPYEVNFNYTEANAWQYRFAAPQDVRGMVELHGGDQRFIEQLDALFEASEVVTGRNQADITGLVGQYVQGNEPSHHIAYLYNFSGAPYKTQQRVRQIMEKHYSDQPDGLSGNEDCGQMSAWLVFSAMGFYPAVPVGGQYVFGTPLFEKITLQVGQGKTFVIRAENLSAENFYIKNVFLNGKPYPNAWIAHETLLQGGELVFEMTGQPSRWGIAEAARPVSEIKAPAIIPVPFVQAGKRVFAGKQKIELGCLDRKATIYYTTNGNPATTRAPKYVGAFEISENTTLRAIAIRGEQKSHEMTAVFNKMRPGMKVSKYHCSYSNQYTGRGELGLIDQIRGAADFRSGDWQGFEGQHFDVIFDLGKIQKISRVTAGFLQDENSWIFFPELMEVEISEDGKGFRTVGSVATTFPATAKGTILQDFVLSFKQKTKARYVRVRGISLLKCPEWHKGADNACWLMADEVMVE